MIAAKYIAQIVGGLIKLAAHSVLFFLGKSWAEKSALKKKVKNDEKARIALEKERTRTNSLDDDALDNELRNNR